MLGSYSTSKCNFIKTLREMGIKEVKIPLRQRQRVRERNFCVLMSSFLVFILGSYSLSLGRLSFQYGNDNEYDELKAMSRSSFCVQKRIENDSDIALSMLYLLSLS